MKNVLRLVAAILVCVIFALTVGVNADVGGISAKAFPQQVTAAQLATITADGTKGLRIVTNASSSASCTAGPGSVKLLCFDDGTWRPMARLADLGGGTPDLSNYSGNTLFLAPGGFNFFGANDTLAAMGGGDGTKFASIHLWNTGDLDLAYGDGVLGGGEGASVIGDPVTGNFSVNTPGRIFLNADAGESFVAVGSGGVIIRGGTSGTVNIQSDHFATDGMTIVSGSSFGAGPANSLKGVWQIDTADPGTPGYLRYKPAASPPFACSNNFEGLLYSDTSHALCYCDGAAWNKISGAGTCS